ncbi:putative membrane protein [Catenulispora sp. GAS73]|uniref:DoxX family protein n=1 Tax=Catenulispora sp. GAS73 TaxID=3156269 RepID=UPI00351773E0
MPRLTSSHAALAGLLASAAVTHFVAPKQYDAIVPRSLPGSPRMWTYVSGAAELAVAVTIANPKSRRQGSLAAAALFVAVFPANVKMARDWSDRPAPARAAAWGRLPLQVPLVWWALKVAGNAANKG